MENISWGSVPTKRSKKTEKYSTPVMTMASLEGKGTGRKFSFNVSAATTLGLVEGEENRVSFGFPVSAGEVDKRMFLRKAEGEEGFKLTKSYTVSDKKTYEYIINRLELDDQVENEFDLIPVEGCFELVLKSTKEEIITFESQDLGTISEEEVKAEINGKADLSAIPLTEEDGKEITADEELVTESSSTDEDVW